MSAVIKPSPDAPHDEVAPLLRPWRGLAPLVVRLIAAEPKLAARLMMAPRRVLHTMAAFMQARAAEGMGEDHAALAAEIQRHDPRDLLRIALGGTEPRLYRALDRCGETMWPLEDYRALLRLLQGPFAGVVLKWPEVSRGLFSHLLEAERDPVVVAAVRTIIAEPDLLHDLRAALVLLRRLGVAEHIERLPAGSGRDAIVRRMEMDLRKVPIPTPCWVPPPGWRHITSWGEVMAIGRAMENCLTSLAIGNGYYAMLLRGHLAMLTKTDGSPSLAAVEWVGPGMWKITETQIAVRVGQRLRLIKRLEEDMRVVLALSGEMLVDRDPLRSIGSLHDPLRDLAMAED